MVKVWDYNNQCFVETYPCEGEKRVRIDVHDDLANYGVFEVEERNEMIMVVDGTPLTDYRIDLT